MHDRESVVEAIVAPDPVRLGLRQRGVEGKATRLHDEAIRAGGRVNVGSPTGEFMGREEELGHGEGVGGEVGSLPDDRLIRGGKDETDGVKGEEHGGDIEVGSIGGPDRGRVVVVEEDEVTISEKGERKGGGRRNGGIGSPQNGTSGDNAGGMHVDGQREGEGGNIVVGGGGGISSREGEKAEVSGDVVGRAAHEGEEQGARVLV